VQPLVARDRRAGVADRDLACADPRADLRWTRVSSDGWGCGVSALTAVGLGLGDRRDGNDDTSL
jgi:hypothetical protein